MHLSKDRKKYALWLLDDGHTPEVVRLMWLRWAESRQEGSLFSGISSEADWEVRFFSEFTEKNTSPWSQVGEPAQRLFHLTYPLHRAVDKDAVFVVDANLWIQRPLAELLCEVSGPMVVDTRELRRVGFAIYFPKHSDFSRLCGDWLKSEPLGYEHLAQWESPLISQLPTSWLPQEASRDNGRAVIDLRKYHHRPWLSGVAPFAQKWSGLGRDLLIGTAALERDRLNFLVRPSLFVSSLEKCGGDFHAAEDANLRHPAFYPSAEQVRFIHSKTFRNRMNHFRRRAERFKAIASGKQPRSFLRRVKDRILNRLFRYWDWRMGWAAGRQ